MTSIRYKIKEKREKRNGLASLHSKSSNLFHTIFKALTHNISATFLFSFLFLLFSVAVGQQTYPVRSSIAIKYPSVFLEEYADFTNTTASVTLLDLQKQNYNVLVKLSMESADLKLTSKEPIQLTLNGGIPTELNFNDPNIAKLFAFSNLIPEKGKIAEFQATRALLEGLYLVKLEVYDANFPNINVSNVNANITTILVQRFDPPMLNLPIDKDRIVQNPYSMNLFFSWAPRSVMANPNIQIFYEIKMVEVPEGKAPFDALNVAGKVYPITMLVDSGLTFPTFSYTPDQLPMNPGSTYAWQVIAYEQDQTTGARRYQRFRNSGKSEAFTFTIQEDCQQIDAASIITRTTADNVEITWDKVLGHTEYELNYREMGSIYQWTPIRATVLADGSEEQTISIDVNSLEKGIQYEFKIAAKCKSWQPEVYGGLFKVQKQDCSAPEPIKIESTPTEVVLSWLPTDNTQKYRLRYKGGNNALLNEQMVDVTSTSTTLPVLQTGKTYQIIVDAVCNSGNLDLGKTYTIRPGENGYAGGCPIPQPFKLIIDHTPNTPKTTFRWSATAGMHKSFKFYVVRKDLYDLAPTTVAWAQAATILPQLDIDTLVEDRLYAYKVDYICDNGQVSTTAVGNFKLEKEPIVVVNTGTGNCFPPATHTAEGITDNSAAFEWSKSQDAEEYQLLYAPLGSNDFKVFNTTQKNTTLEDLDIGTTHIYQYMIRARCPNAKYSLFTDTALVDLSKRYTGTCKYEGIFRSDNQATNEIRLVWKHTDNMGYVVTYREESQNISDVYTSQINGDSITKNNLLDGDSIRFTIRNLEAKTNYVFYLQPVCGTEQGKKLGPLNVATLEGAPNGACGEGKVVCDSKSQTPLLESQLVGIQQVQSGGTSYYEYDKAPPSSIFQAADIDIIAVGDVSYNAGTKTFTGNGVAKMELDLGNVGKALNGGNADVNLTDRIKTSVKFSNIIINDARCLIKGTVEVTGIELNVLSDEQKAQFNKYVDQYNKVLQQLIDAGKQLSEALELAKNYTEQAENYLDGGQKYGNVKTGSIVPVPANADYSVNGNTVKDNSGNTIGTLVTPAPTLTAKDTTLCQKCGKYVSFSNGPTAAYDFDEYKSEYFTHRKVAREYRSLRYEGGKYYNVSAKALVEGKVDKVKANLNGYTATDLVFKSGAGLTYAFNTTDLTITIPGGAAGDGQDIFVYSKSKGDSVVGRLLVANYPSITKKVVFVTVGDPTKWQNKPGFSVPDVKAKVTTLLAESYNKIGIKYDIELDELTLKTDDSWDAAPKDGMVQDSKSGFLDNGFTGEEKTLTSLYYSYFEKLDTNKVYLFFTPDGKLIDSDLQGKMPRGRKTGFIFMQGSNLNTVAKTVLHELGHGPHTLHHLFNSDWLGNDANVSNVRNLMAYGDGSNLIKSQWDIMHDPGFVIGFFERDKDAQALLGDVKAFLEEIRSHRISGTNLILKGNVINGQKTWRQDDIVFDKYEYPEITIKFLPFKQDHPFNTSLFYEFSEEVEGFFSNTTYYGISYLDGDGKKFIKILLESKLDRDRLVKYLFGDCDYIEKLNQIHNASANNKNVILTYMNNCTHIDILKDKEINGIKYNEIYCKFTNVNKGTAVVIDPKKYKEVLSGFELYEGNNLVFTINYFKGNMDNSTYITNKNKLKEWLFEGSGGDCYYGDITQTPDIAPYRGSDMVSKPKSTGTYGCVRTGSNTCTQGTNNKKHGGYDVMLSENSHLTAVLDGVITFGQQDANDINIGWGKFVTLASKGKDGSTLNYYYCHINSAYKNLKSGNSVKKGDTIALSGKTGNANPEHIIAHCHLELYRNGVKSVDPGPFLKTSFDNSANAIKCASGATTSNSNTTSVNFNKYISEVLNTEGGFVDDPIDKGGATNRGITFNIFKAYAKSLLGVDPTIENLKVITADQAKTIYKNVFWDPADKITDGNIAYMYFDFNVNSGPNAAKKLQETLNDMGESLTVDGKIGNATITAINSKNAKTLFENYKNKRLNFVQSISDNSVAEFTEKYKQENNGEEPTEAILLAKTQKRFLKGWQNRINSITYED